MTRNKLDALEERGQQAEREQRKKLTREQQAEQDRRAEMAALSTTSLGYFRTYGGGMLIAFAALGLGAYFVMWPGSQSKTISDAQRVLRYIAPFVMAPLAVLVIRGVVGVIARVHYRRTLGWLRALPFDVRSIDKLLAESPCRKAFEARIVMPPGTDLDRISSIIMGLRNRRITSAVSDGTVRVRFAVAGQLDEIRTAPQSNHRGLRLFRHLVDDLLLEIHAKTPIISIELDKV